MVDSAPRAGFGWLRSAFAAVRERDESDGDLLRRYAHHHDEQAFGELVRRLGPTVYGVCRRHLGNSADADDAFQATFLVLSRKAGTVNPPGRVAAWVYGVANLSARKLRQTRLRRTLRERAVHPLPDTPTPEPEMDSALLPAVDEELGQLPDRFRLPIVLCGVRGMTVAAAAAELGWPVGTVASRLSRGRAELTKRLAKRGITLGAVTVGIGWGELAAGVPPQLLERTVTAITGGTLPPAVTALSSEVANVMTWSPIRRLTAGLLCLSGLALATGGGLMLQSGTAAPVPTATTKPKATLERVKLDDVSGLLRQGSVRKQIGLSDADYKKLTDFRKGKQQELNKVMAAGLQALIQGQGPGRKFEISAPDEQFTEDMRKLQSEFAKKAEESLTPDGRMRLKQATLQMQGPRVLLHRVVIRELQLTAEQEDAIDAVLPAQNDQVIEADELGKMAKDRDAKWAEVLKVLSPEQRKRWDALVGKSFDTTALLKASPLSEESMNEEFEALDFGVINGFQGMQIPVPGGAVPLPVQKKKE